MTPSNESLTYNSWVGTMADCMSNEEFTDTERDLASFVHAALTLGQMTPELASWLDQRGLEALENTDGD